MWVIKWRDLYMGRDYYFYKGIHSAKIFVKQKQIDKALLKLQEIYQDPEGIDDVYEVIPITIIEGA